MNWLTTLVHHLSRGRLFRPGSGGKARIYQCGTLRYTGLGLCMVFFWLLWGDFTMQLMEAVLPAILPLQLKALNAPNSIMGIILVTVPSAMNFLVNPIVSFRSDRHRGPWGRRKPFLLIPTPFITAALVALAYAPEIGAWVHEFVATHGSFGKNAVTIGTIGVLIVMFQFFNMFISSVYFYLFNDVVPEAYLARFMAMFRVVGTLAAMTFNFYIFPLALTHMREIFLGAALLYFIGFTSMCLGLKEGKYPPPPPLVGKHKGVIAGFQTYFRECFTHPYYLIIFAYGAMMQLARTCEFVANLFYLHLGITLEQVGKLHAWLAVPGLILMVPLGILCDRVHPIRVIIWAVLLLPLTAAISFLFIHDFNSLLAVTIITFPVTAILSAANMPLLFLILPKERFGQFGSADAMARSLTVIAGSLVAGPFLDFMKTLYHGNEEYYRWMYVWSGACQALACFFAWRIYAGWKKHGGYYNYKAPDTGRTVPAVNAV